jgi:hypothetical protein
MLSKYELTKVWSDTIVGDYHWDLYATITFRSITTTIAAEKAFKYFFKHLNQSGICFFDKFIRCFIAFEKDTLDNGRHIHALISGINPDLSSKLQKECISFFGESKVEPYIKGAGASEYIARKCLYPDKTDFKRLEIHSR